MKKYIGNSAVLCFTVLLAISTLTAGAAPVSLFFDDFSGPALNPIWQASLPNAPSGSYPYGFTQSADYVGAPNFSFQTLDGSSVLRLTNTLGELQRCGWSSISNFVTGDFRYEARFNTLTQSPTTSIDGFIEIWIINATNSSLYDIVSPFEGDYGSIPYFFVGSSIDGSYTQTPFVYTNNTWYRLVLTGAAGQNIRASILADDGTELVGSTLAHGAAAYGSGFRIALSQVVGGSGAPFPVDVAVDYVKLTSGSSGTSAVPVIASFSPGAAAVSNSVTITGNNFGPTPAGNIVYFGAVRAPVISASPTSLVVNVPAGATYAPITVTVNGLTAFAPAPFLPTFLGDASLSSASLGAPVVLGAGVGPAKVVVGDLDGDGKPDLLVCNANDGSIGIYRNLSTNGTLLADASFAPPFVLTVSNAAQSVMGLTLADLDGDGRLDILIADYNLNQISIFQNFSSPGVLTSNSFGAEVDIPVSGIPASIAVADLDGDGRPDIVTANHQDDTISVLKNLGGAGAINAGWFAAPVSFATGPSPWVVAIADLDGDGNPDILALDQSDPNHRVSIFHNLGTGGISTDSFAPAVDLAGAETSETLAVGDLDGDGKPDVVVGSYTDNTISIYRNTSVPGVLDTNSFAPEVAFGAGGRVHTVTLGDLDGDGKLDIAAVTELPSGLELFKNLSTPGSFTTNSLGPEIDFPSGNNAIGVAIADLDGDGRSDLAFANQYGGTVYVYQNLNPFGTPPVITQQPASATNVVGTTATFSVTASSGTPLSYQWYFDTTNLVAGATNAVLTLTDVQLTNGGNYAVLVSNSGGSTNSATAVLTVNAPQSPFTDGLVAYYPFDGNANDASGNSNNLTVNGATLCADRFGNTNQAYYFNGNSYLSSTKVPLSQIDNWTVTAWVNPASLSGQGDDVVCVGYDNGQTGNGYAINLNGNQLEVALGGWGIYASGYVFPSANQWYQVVMLSTNNTQMFYVNGAYVGSSAAHTPYPPATSFTIGSADGFRYFNGAIDDVRIYNRALSANEVTGLYAAETMGSPVITQQPASSTILAGTTATFSVTAFGTAPLSYQWSFDSSAISGATNAVLTLTDVQLTNAGNYAVLVSNSGGSTNSATAVLTVNALQSFLTNGLVAYYPFDGNANDASGNSNNLVVNGATLCADRFGNPNQAYYFNGASYLDSTRVPLSQVDNWTVVAWVNPASLSNQGDDVVCVGYDNGQTGNGYAINLNGNQLEVALGGWGIYASGYVFPSANQWYQVVMLSTNNTQMFYVNGVYAGSSAAHTPYPPATSFTIGSADGFRYFNGAIDDVRIYNRALSANEVAGLYASDSTEPPVITSQPASATNVVGTTATFSVTASSGTPLSYQWYFDTTNLVAGATNAVLTLTDVQLTNGGNYAVRVSNSGGSTNSATAVLTVNASPSPFTDGLVAYYPFDGNANDASGNSNNLVVNGATLCADRFGNTNQAYYFNGNSYLDSAKAPLSQADNWTVTAWVNPASLSGLQDVVCVGYDNGQTGNGFSLNISGNQLEVVLSGWGIYPSGYVFPSANQWYQVVMLSTNNTQMFYVNGAYAGSSAVHTASPPATSFTIGSANGLRYFNGAVDDVRIYNRALTANEVAGLYAAETTGSPVITSQPAGSTVLAGTTATLSVTAFGTAPLSYQWSFDSSAIAGATNAVLTLTDAQLTNGGNYAVLVSNSVGSTNSATAELQVLPIQSSFTNGLVAYYPFDGNANDASGNSNNLVVNGATLCADRFGNTNQAYYFNGNSYLDSTKVPLSQADNWTVTAWVNPASLSGLQDVVCVGYDNGQTGNGFSLNISGNQLEVVLSGWGIYPSGYVFPSANQWYQVVMLSTNNTQMFYVNGAYVGSSAVHTASPPASSFTIGSANGLRYFNGAVDDVSIYNRALTANEVAGLYAAESTESPAPPVITSQPASATNVVGTTATFSVTASSGTPLSYQWSFDSSAITGATNAVLTLTDVQLTNGGNYAVLVSNSGGSTNSATAVLTVNAPATDIPVITSFSPGAAAVSNGVAITGLNFSSVAVDDIVYFGAVRAAVETASPTNLQVQVPAGATYAPITVTVNGLTAYAATPFLPTFAGNAGLGSTSLAAPALLGAGNGPGRLVVGDLDGDGRADLVVLNGGDGTIDVYRNLSTNGTLATASFAAPVVLTITNGANSVVGLALADLDGDGRLDIVVGDYNLEQVSIFQNFSSPGSLTTNSFGGEVDIPVSGSPSGVAVADLDGDGRPEIVTANQQNNTVSVLKNLGGTGAISAGWFAAPVSFATGLNPWVVAVADLDGDGLPDIITLDQSDPNHRVSIFRNLGTGGISTNSFAPAVDLAGAETSETLAVGDLDGDGKPDVVVGSYTYHTISVYRNTSVPGTLGTNSFAPEVIFGAGGRVHTVALGDLDGDGKLDLAAVTELPSGLELFKNLSTPGSFTTNSLGPEIDFSSEDNASSVVIADLDGDGRSDLVFGNDYSGTVEIYRNIVPVGTAPVITAQPTNETVAIGGGASFSVTASSATPLSYQWFYDETNLLTGATNAVLTLADVQLTNGGNYTVLVSNSGGSTNSAVAVLTVPETVLTLGSTNTMSGNTIVVPVWANAVGTENTLLASVGYDPTKLVLQSVQLGQALSGAYLQPVYTQTNAGYVGFAILLNTGATLPAGTNEVADLIFSVQPVTNTTTVNLAFGDFPTGRQIVDNNLNALPAVYQGGSVVISPVEYEADVYPRPTGDNQVNIFDWLEVGRMVAGLDVPTNTDELRRADCSPRNAPDGVLTVADWVQAGRYALGLDPLTLVNPDSIPALVKASLPKPLGGPAPTRILQIVNVSALRGQTVNVPVQLVCTANENAVGMTIAYNPNLLQLVNVTLGANVSGGRLNVNTNRPGKIGIVLAASPGASLPPGTNQVAVLQFTAGANASGPAALTFESTVVQLQVADNAANSLGTTYVNGAVILPAQPALTVTGSGSNLQFSWPIAAGTFEVQSADSVLGPWTTIILPIVTNGANASVTVLTTNRQQYFRLGGQ